MHKDRDIESHQESRQRIRWHSLIDPTVAVQHTEHTTENTAENNAEEQPTPQQLNGRQVSFAIEDGSLGRWAHLESCGSSEPQFVAVGPPDVDGFPDVVTAVDLLARYLGDGL